MNELTCFLFWPSTTSKIPSVRIVLMLYSSDSKLLIEKSVLVATAADITAYEAAFNEKIINSVRI